MVPYESTFLMAGVVFFRGGMFQGVIFGVHG